MNSKAPIVLADQEGEHLFYDGGLLTFKATGAQTDGALLLFEVQMPRGKATPLHVHPDAGETLCVLDGEIKLYIEGRADELASSGAVAVIPRGTPHAFAVSSQWVRMLVSVTPASATSEEFFRLAGEPASDPTQTPPPANPERFAAAAERAGLKILGPPPFPPGNDPSVATAAGAQP